MSNLSQLKIDLRSMLGDFDDNAGWEDSVLEEGIARGLTMYNESSLPAEDNFTVTTTGYEQDLSSLSALKIHAIRLEWSDGDTFYAQKRRRWEEWRQVSRTTVRFDHVEIQSGDILRVRYQKIHTIDGLSGGTETTIPSTEEYVLVLAAAHWACLLRYRQVSRSPSSAPTDVGALLKMSDMYKKDFYERINVLGSPGTINWEGIGL